jgi:hypothetical protein
VLEVVCCDGIHAPHEEEVSDLYESWLAFGTDGSRCAEHERAGLRRLLREPELQELGEYSTIQIRVSGHLSGLAILEQMDGQYATCQYVKCNLNFAGINEFMFRSMALLLRAKNLRWLNHQEDLDLAGLRKSKLSFRPAYLYEKFSLSDPSNTVIGDTGQWEAPRAPHTVLPTSCDAQPRFAKSQLGGPLQKLKAE